MQKVTKGGEVAIYEKKLIPIVEESLKIKVVDDEGLVMATEILSRLNKLNDMITEEKEKVTVPLNEALKAERARWKPLEDSYKKGIEWLRGQAGAYQTAKLKKQREEEAKVAAKMAQGKIDINKAGDKLVKIEEESGLKKVATDSGKLSFREVDTLKITDENKIPREYLIVDEKKVLEALKAGKVVAGCEIEVVAQPINYR